MHKFLTCNLCGMDDVRIIQKAESPFLTVKCRNCGLVYVTPMPERQIVENHYIEDYYRKWLVKELTARTRMWKNRLKGLKKYRNNGRLLDVGCGEGTFLKLARETGFDVSGTEISAWACQYIADKYGIKVLKGTLEEAEFSPSIFDIVTFWHSLEHMPDPMKTLKETSRILKTGGLLVIAVPNVNNFIVRMLYFLAKGKKLKFFSSQAKELHFYHFSPMTLSLMLKKNGFKPIKTDMDLAQIAFHEKIVDCLTAVFYFITGKNFGEAFKIYAIKI